MGDVEGFPVGFNEGSNRVGDAADCWVVFGDGVSERNEGERLGGVVMFGEITSGSSREGGKDGDAFAGVVEIDCVGSFVDKDAMAKASVGGSVARADTVSLMLFSLIVEEASGNSRGAGLGSNLLPRTTDCNCCATSHTSSGCKTMGVMGMVDKL